jgi:electron transport complex protein RnfC
MNSILERIKNNNFWTFHGGINPPEQKQLTTNKPIRQLNLPDQLILPLQQHIGSQGHLLVKQGDKVLKGQPLTLSNNPMEVPIHAPTSGTISAIKKSVIAHPSGLSELCIFIDVDHKEKWVKREITENFKSLTAEFIVKKIAKSGISGMGGAGFPTNIKVATKEPINFLIINGVECEPYITADDLLMREQSSAIVDGIEILDHVLLPACILIAIEDNKPEAIKALEKATAHIEKIKVCVIPTKYPSGGEKQLIKILTGKEVESGKLPIHSGIVMQNVGTCFAISDAIINDIPLIRRVVTVSGRGLAKPQNVWAPLGTTVKTLLEQCGYEGMNKLAINEINRSKASPIIMGGPMMGFSLFDENTPVVKTTNCILAPSEKEMPSAFEHISKEVECIRCGQCADVCPSKLLPQELQWSAKAKDYEQLEKLNLSDCIDCGACAYVCPSQIPLVQYYRVAKAEIRQQNLLDLKAEHAKKRFENRKLRLEKEKEARIAKHKKAAEARKAAMNKNTSEASSAKSAVAAALARVKAKKSASKSDTSSADKSNAPDENAKIEDNRLVAKQENKKTVSAAVMGTKEKAKIRAQEKAKSASTESKIVETKPTKKITPDRSDIDSEHKGNNSNVGEANSAEQKKKEKLAAAVARAKEKAKAKTLNKAKSTQDNTVEVDEENTAELKKKEKLAVAVARAKEKAKAKALNKAKSTQDNTEEVDEQSTAELKKKEKLAAAVARAKEKAKAKALDKAKSSKNVAKEEAPKKASSKLERKLTEPLKDNAPNNTKNQKESQ